MMDVEVGPALGMKHRHAVRGYALEQVKREKDWFAVRQLDNSEMAELIGDVVDVDEAIARTEAWLAGERVLGGEPAHPND